MIWGEEQRAVVLAGPSPSALPGQVLVEVAVPGAADEGGPFGGREYQGRAGRVPGVADRDLAVGQVRDLDAVAALRAAPAALAPRHLGQFSGGRSVPDAHRLVLQLVDDRGEDSWCLARPGADDAEPLHGQQVTVDIAFLVEVEGAGEVLQVSDVRQVRLAEPQDAEPARRGVAAHAERRDLQREVLPAAQAEQVAELVAQDLGTPDRPPQRGFLDDGPQLEPSPG